MFFVPVWTCCSEVNWNMYFFTTFIMVQHLLLYNMYYFITCIILQHVFLKHVLFYNMCYFTCMYYFTECKSGHAYKWIMLKKSLQLQFLYGTLTSICSVYSFGGTLHYFVLSTTAHKPKMHTQVHAIIILLWYFNCANKNFQYYFVGVVLARS